jgi:hypothetical protein
MTRTRIQTGRFDEASAARHDEWLIDDAIDDTFPASDPTSHAQPGSIVSRRYEAAARRRWAAARGATSALWWILAGSALCSAVLVSRRRRRPTTRRA